MLYMDFIYRQIIYGGQNGVHMYVFMKVSFCETHVYTCVCLQKAYVRLLKFEFLSFDGYSQRDNKRKPPCVGGMELVSLSCNRVFKSAESARRTMLM